ncbi:MAG: transglutaminase domain-containing protein, partial [Treponema sp.]|nr:transglutaminase domain-containing protein [Treponema sp.]
QVKRYSDRQRLLYSMFTSSDSCVPSSNPAIIQLVQSVVGREKNPYRQAKLIYEYLIENFTVYQEVRAGNVTVLDMLEQKYGDAYDFSVMFTALCRAAGIPALPVSGILVEDNATTRNHWWAEVYFEGYGWFPVDPALGAGLNLPPSRKFPTRRNSTLATWTTST